MPKYIIDDIKEFLLILTEKIPMKKILMKKLLMKKILVEKMKYKMHLILYLENFKLF